MDLIEIEHRVIVKRGHASPESAIKSLGVEVGDLFEVVRFLAAEYKGYHDVSVILRQVVKKK